MIYVFERETVERIYVKADDEEAAREKLDRTPREFHTVEYERERLEIDGPSVVIVHRCKGKARVEVRKFERMPKVKKVLEESNDESVA